ncbi:hypothetical protein HMPREF0083_02530 [Aneurinibacillus aneurinilyticus ATCC 12856]|uniref:Uncharacterized protein n=1 Tax=Aneurinibacillus aneurinilyticus ATCC 12856 TaxID=649747 RepID=U1YF46_ANEAE|nr:hypothetical protein HMPREF0083_02530 [Aneurinibacillus aneurinilyticus ATCC 12856]
MIFFTGMRIAYIKKRIVKIHLLYFSEIIKAVNEERRFYL